MARPTKFDANYDSKRFAFVFSNRSFISIFTPGQRRTMWSQACASLREQHNEVRTNGPLIKDLMTSTLILDPKTRTNNVKLLGRRERQDICGW